MKKDYKDLYEISEKSLISNIIKTKKGTFLVAGQSQFKSLWSRDFLFSVPALLYLGFDNIVKNQLELLLKFKRNNDGLIPRTLDSKSVKTRVVLNTFLRFLPEKIKNMNIDYPLKPEYIGEHGKEAFDSNLIYIINAILYFKKYRDDEVW